MSGFTNVAHLKVPAAMPPLLGVVWRGIANGVARRRATRSSVCCILVTCTAGEGWGTN